MAHYVPPTLDLNASRLVKIVSTENVENYTLYHIEMSLGPYRWKVKHRYSRFHELHEKLVLKHKIDKNLLPPKRLFGNQSEAFIKKRQGELEIYLQTLFEHFKVLPYDIVTFLHFDKYEIHGITQCLAENLFHKGDLILSANESFHVSPLQLYAVCARLKLQEPSCDMGDAKRDLGHILDFLTCIKHVKITGQLDQVGGSNILMNDLSFDLSIFKALEHLELAFCNPNKILSADVIKKTVKKLKVFQSVSNLKDVLLVDVAIGQWFGSPEESVLVPVWSALTSATFTYNRLTTIDESVKLMPRVEELDLNHNHLLDISHLQNLSALKQLNVSHNCIRRLESLHTKLGNIKSLNLANNKLESLQAFSKLYSLEHLDVRSNEICQVSEVLHLSGLPCLESIIFTKNPVTVVVDYRTKVLELFKERAKEISLDGGRATQKELDTVAILLALRKSKELKEKNKKPKKAREAEIRDMSSDSSRSNSPAVVVNDGEASTSVDLSTPRQTSPAPPSEASSSRDSATSSRIESLQIQNPNVANTASKKPTGLPPKLGYQFILDWANADLANPQSGTLLPETLPSRNDSTFLAHIQTLLPSTNSLSKQSRTREERREHQQERTVHVMWSTVICYTDPTREILACLCLTTENIHILEVRSLRGARHLPALFHVYCIPLVNLQQVVLGYSRQYLRIEEAFVGPQGTYVLLTGSIAKSDLFLDSLKLAYRRAISDIDQYEDPHISVNEDTEMLLRAVLNQIEMMEDARDIEIVLYMLVNSRDFTNPNQPFITHSLVMTSRYVFLIKEDYILWPQATFSVGIPTWPQFTIACAFPISGRITGIQMYDSDTYSPDQDTSLSQNFSATKTCAMVVPNFIGFGVKLVFDVGSMQTLDIRVPTSGMRDRFLACLTQVRKDQTDRSAVPVKSSKTRAKGPDRDVDSLSTSSNGSPRGTRPKHHKQTATSKKGRQRSSKAQPTRKTGNRPDLLPDLPISSPVRPKEKPTEFTPMHKTKATEKKLPEKVMISSDSASGPESSDDQAEEDQAYLLLRESPTGESESSDSNTEDLIPDSILADNRDEPIDTKLHLALSANDTVEVFHTPTGSLQGSEILASSMGSQTATKPTIMKSQFSLDVQYPSMQLLSHLTECNQQMQLVFPLSEALRNLSLMEGDELLNFFHSSVAQIGHSTEELKHILWCPVIMYARPQKEIPACVMLSNKFIYCVSDVDPTSAGMLKNKEWMSHSRNKSDSYRLVTKTSTRTGASDIHLSSGVIHKSKHSTSELLKTPRPFLTMIVKDLKEVSVGLFDQVFRLMGETAENTVACLTRDNQLTALFIKHLTLVLSAIHPTPSPELPTDPEQDFYSMFNNYNRLESQEYRHPSKVTFFYPNEDLVNEFVFVLAESIKNIKEEPHLLLHLLVYETMTLTGASPAKSNAAIAQSHDAMKSRTIIMTEKYLAIAEEDHIHYPIPTFACGPPAGPRLRVLRLHNLNNLKRVTLSKANSHLVRLIFADEPIEIVVNCDFDHYTNYGGKVPRHVPRVPEVVATFTVQNLLYKEKLVSSLQKQLSEIRADGPVLAVLTEE